MGELIKIFPRKGRTRGNESGRKISGNDASQKLKEEVEIWAKELKWKFNGFMDFLKLIEVKTSINLTDDLVAEIFYENGKLSKISFETEEVCIGFLSYNDGRKIIEIAEQTNRREYEVICQKEPSVQLKEKTIEGPSVNLYFKYDGFLFEIIVFFTNKEILKIEIEGVSDKVIESDEYINNYLLNLNSKSLDVVKIYETLLQLFCLSGGDISKCEEISIVHFKECPIDDEVISKLLVEEGEWKEYAVTEGEEKLYLSAEGERKYSFGTEMKVSYAKGQEGMEFNVTINGCEGEKYADMAQKVSKKIQEVEEEFRMLEAIMESIIV